MSDLTPISARPAGRARPDQRSRLPLCRAAIDDALLGRLLATTFPRPRFLREPPGPGPHFHGTV